MIWILYMLADTTMPNLQEITRYTDETFCRQAVKELAENNIKAVCLPKQELKNDVK